MCSGMGVYTRPRLLLRYCRCCVRCTLGRVMVRHVKQLVNLSYNGGAVAAAGVRCTLVFANGRDTYLKKVKRVEKVEWVFF